MITFSLTTIGAMTAHTPSTISRLNRFDPITLLTASPFDPFIAEEILTASSGALVPIATMVSPTMSEGIFIFFAREELPSTKKSAPFISTTKPARSRIIESSIVKKMSSFQ